MMGHTDTKQIVPSLIDIMEAVSCELTFARAKFPGTEKVLSAFNEEAGELTKAMLQCHFDKRGADDVFAEGVQTIAMVVRILQEGDTDFKYKPNYSQWEVFMNAVKKKLNGLRK